MLATSVLVVLLGTQRSELASLTSAHTYEIADVVEPTFARSNECFALDDGFCHYLDQSQTPRAAGLDPLNVAAVQTKLATGLQNVLVAEDGVVTLDNKKAGTIQPCGNTRPITKQTLLPVEWEMNVDTCVKGYTITLLASAPEVPPDDQAALTAICKDSATLSNFKRFARHPNREFRLSMDANECALEEYVTDFCYSEGAVSLRSTVRLDYVVVPCSSATATAPPAPSAQGLSTAAIAGISAGAVVVVAAVGAVWACRGDSGATSSAALVL